MRAKYTPNVKNMLSYLEHCIGKVYDWIFINEVKGIRYYTTQDIKFGSSQPIRERDLTKVDDEQV